MMELTPVAFNNQRSQSKSKLATSIFCQINLKLNGESNGKEIQKGTAQVGPPMLDNTVLSPTLHFVSINISSALWIVLNVEEVFSLLEQENIFKNNIYMYSYWKLQLSKSVQSKNVNIREKIIRNRYVSNKKYVHLLQNNICMYLRTLHSLSRRLLTFVTCLWSQQERAEAVFGPHHDRRDLHPKQPT